MAPTRLAATRSDRPSTRGARAGSSPADRSRSSPRTSPTNVGASIGRDAEEQAAERARHPQRDGDADDDTRRRRPARPGRTTMRRTCSALAPSAMRTPISRVRCGDDVRQDAVETDGAEDERQRRRDAERQHRERQVHHRIARQSGHREHAVHRRPGAISRTIARTSGAIVSARGVLMTYAGDEITQLVGSGPTSGK